MDPITKPALEATMAEFQSVTSHSFCASNNSAVFYSTMEAASKSARHAMHPQIVHNHGQGDRCNAKCLLVEPMWDDVGRKGLPHLQKPESVPEIESPAIIDTSGVEQAIADLDKQFDAAQPEIPFRHNETEGYGNDGHLS